MSAPICPEFFHPTIADCSDANLPARVRYGLVCGLYELAQLSQPPDYSLAADAAALATRTAAELKLPVETLVRWNDRAGCAIVSLMLAGMGSTEY